MYAILRTEKLKNEGKISVSLDHNNRNRKCDNADPNLSHKNEYIKTTNWEEIKQETEPYMTRKDNVRCVEFVLTASPEFFENISEEKLQDWKKENIDFLNKMFGEENIVNLAVHRDEQTPHIHAHIIPMHEGKLNCKHYLGGKEKMRKMQTEYAQKMEKFGLKRGIEGSKAKHDKIEKYYGRVNTPDTPTVTLEKPNRFGNLDQYTQENQTKINEVNQIAQAKTQELERQKSLVESQKKALQNLRLQYENIESKEKLLAQEKLHLEQEKKKFEMKKAMEIETIAKERQKNIENEVRNALKIAQTNLEAQTTTLEKEKASIATREAKMKELAFEVAGKYIAIENMITKKIIESAKDLTKNDHSKNIYTILAMKNNNDISKIVEDVQKIQGITNQRMKDILAHSPTKKVEIKPTQTLKR